MSYREDPREQELRALRAERVALRKVAREYRAVVTVLRDIGGVDDGWRRTLARIDAALGGTP